MIVLGRNGWFIKGSFLIHREVFEELSGCVGKGRFTISSSIRLHKILTFIFAGRKSKVERKWGGGFSLGRKYTVAGTSFQFSGFSPPYSYFVFLKSMFFPLRFFPSLFSFLPSLCHPSCTKMILLIALNTDAPLL